MSDASETLQVGLLLFPRLTVLDLIGPYQVFTRTPGVEVHLVAKTRDPVPDQACLSLVPTTDFAAAPRFDLFCVPGGPGDEGAIDDAETLDYVRQAGGAATWLTSVCTGSLILGAAGLLRGRRATSHWSAREVLSAYGAIPEAGRVVEDGSLITGGGVTSGIDFALHVVAKLRGEAVAQAIQLTLEYAPEPPFAAGRPDTAPEAVRDRVMSLTGDLLKRRMAQAERVVRGWSD